MPLCSVVLPVRNGERYLDVAVRSILAQTLSDLELIVVTDGSTDSSTAIVRSHRLRDPRVKLVELPPSGIVRALNTGIEASRGEYIARMDADDVALPLRLERQVEYLRADPSCAAVGCQVLFIDEDGDPIAVNRLPLDHASIERGLLQGRGECLRHPSAVFRRDRVVAIGGYAADAELAEDVDLFLRLADIGCLANLPETLLEYRIHLWSANFLRWQEQSRVVHRVVAAAYRRRGCDRAPTTLDLRPPQADRARWYASWSVKACMGGHPRTGRKLARKSLRVGTSLPVALSALIASSMGPMTRPILVRAMAILRRARSAAVSRAR